MSYSLRNFYSTGSGEGERSGHLLRILDATSSSTLSDDGGCFRFGCPAGGLRPPYRGTDHQPAQHDPNPTDIYIEGDNNNNNDNSQANYQHNDSSIRGFPSQRYGRNGFERLGSVRAAADGRQFSQESTPNDVRQFHDSFLRLLRNNNHHHHHYAQDDYYQRPD